MTGVWIKKNNSGKSRGQHKLQNLVVHQNFKLAMICQKQLFITNKSGVSQSECDQLMKELLLFLTI